MSSVKASDAEGDQANAWFKTTHWSVVLAVGSGDPDQGVAALGRLCQTYWYALYTYIRRSGHGAEDAKDLTQAFFTRILEKEYLNSVVPGKGKFRSFLLIALKRFLANEWDYGRRLKRGGGQQLLSLDEVDTESRYLMEPADDLSPEKLFDRRWALTLLDKTMERLQQEATAAGKSALFLELRDFLSGDGEGPSYCEISRRTGLGEGALRTTVHRLRQRYREVLRQEVANTVETPEEIDDEIRQLFASLG